MGVIPQQSYGHLKSEVIASRNKLRQMQKIIPTLSAEDLGELAAVQCSSPLPSPLEPFPMATIEHHLLTLDHAYCAICLCTTPFALASATSQNHKHTEQACKFYLIQGVPANLEAKFWATFCPLFQGMIPYCDSCDKIGHLIDGEHDALMGSARRAASGRMRLVEAKGCAKKDEWWVVEGSLSAVIWCDCVGEQRDSRKSWRSREDVEALRERRRIAKGKARANSVNDNAGPASPSIQRQTPGGNVVQIDPDPAEDL